MDSYKDKIYEQFKIPIKYIQHNTLNDSLINDLELVKFNTTDNSNNLIDISNNNTIYHKYLDPTTIVGKHSVSNMICYYTNNIDFLKQTQYIVEDVCNVDFDKDNINDMTNLWLELDTYKNDFENKFQYIEWQRLKFLNYWPAFLHILSILNISSPIMQLFAPIFMLILPFLMLKVIGSQVTISNYIDTLKITIRNNPIGKLLFEWNSVSWNTKGYILFTLIMYFYNLYLNVLACRDFYNNAKFIINSLNKTKKYLKYTIDNIDQFRKIINEHSEYSSFLKELDQKYDLIKYHYNQINCIPSSTFSIYNLLHFGNVMKCFYQINNDIEFSDMIDYTLGYNAYIDHIIGIRRNSLKNKIKPITYTNSDTFKLKNVYHPIIKHNKAIKNDIDLKNNLIITGPNAAGKTTILKCTIINLIFSQQFGYGYFTSGKLNPYKYIHCYINIPDNCSRDSLFQSEVRRCKSFLDIIDNNPESRHFCVFDELYSGTNPYEAISSAYSYLNHISKNKNIKFILTTHYIKLCKLFRKHKNIKNYNMKTKTINNNAKYYYKIIKGISKIKGGIAILKNLEYPDSVINNAIEIMNKL